MNGAGFAKGLLVTMRHFVNTYIDDIRYGFKKYSHSVDNFEVRQGTEAKGAFTVQYPEEKVATPERFRFVPFLVVQDYDDEERPGKDWCTSCGICAKVCPPQCIWIVRGNDPDTGRPVPEPENFFIDIDICMNCGFCAEFCPFDAIKMDHDYELASYDRTTNHIFDKDKLSKEMRYWKAIAPTRAVEEAEVRGGWEHKDVQKEKRRGGKTRKKSSDNGSADSSREAKREAVRKRRAEAAAKKKQEEAKAEAKTAEAPAKQEEAKAEATSGGSGLKPWTMSAEEYEKRKQAALKRKAERAARRAED